MLASVGAMVLAAIKPPGLIPTASVVRITLNVIPILRTANRIVHRRHHPRRQHHPRRHRYRLHLHLRPRLPSLSTLPQSTPVFPARSKSLGRARKTATRSSSSRGALSAAEEPTISTRTVSSRRCLTEPSRSHGQYRRSMGVASPTRNPQARRISAGPSLSLSWLGLRLLLPSTYTCRRRLRLPHRQNCHRRPRLRCRAHHRTHRASRSTRTLHT